MMIHKNYQIWFAIKGNNFMTFVHETLEEFAPRKLLGRSEIGK
jgi:hypothetical protein